MKSDAFRSSSPGCLTSPPSSLLVEAANRAEATALLIRCSYSVYRPEVDVGGEDLVLRWPNGDLHPVQLKSRATVDWGRYGERGLWMLFPAARYEPQTPREWFLIPHDKLFEWVKRRHSHTPKWANSWSYPSMPEVLREFLKGSAVRPLPESEKPSP